MRECNHEFHRIIPWAIYGGNLDGSTIYWSKVSCDKCGYRKFVTMRGWQVDTEAMQ